MSKKIIETLKTDRNTWTKAELYKTPAEAREAGLGIIYEDKEGIVFGLRSEKNFYSWDRIGFVPYPGYYDDYAQIAKETEPEEKLDRSLTAMMGAVKVTVTGGEMEEREILAYKEKIKEQHPDWNVSEMKLSIVDDDFVDIECKYTTKPFDRIRRITGYLVGDMHRFNNAKAAEVRDRVKHGLAQQSFDDVYEEARPIGRIDYIGGDGEVGESIEYTDPDKFVDDIKEKAYYGVPMSIVFYRDKDGKTIPTDFVYELDPPPNAVRTEGFYDVYVGTQSEQYKTEETEKQEISKPKKTQSKGFVQSM